MATGCLFRIDIRGRDGIALRDKWADGPRTLLGLATASFPNLSAITGPGSPSVLANMIMGIEQHVDWLADCFAFLRSRGLSRIEARRDDEDERVAHVNEIAGRTIYPTCDSCTSERTFPENRECSCPTSASRRYVAKCNEVAANGYAGFALSD
jgi:cyclohexanone monooxygenase